MRIMKLGSLFMRLTNLSWLYRVNLMLYHVVNFLRHVQVIFKQVMHSSVRFISAVAFGLGRLRYFAVPELRSGADMAEFFMTGWYSRSVLRANSYECILHG